MLDLHFHSKYSDWKKNNSEIIHLAKAKNPTFIACTDHDFINDEFVMLAKEKWINTCHSTEISAYDPEFDQSLHLTCYARNFNLRIRDILSATRVGRVEKNREKIKKLKLNWFKVEENEFFEYYKQQWVNIDNINIFHIAYYIYLNKENVDFIKTITWENLNPYIFLKRFLKRKWDLSQYWFVSMAEYEPKISDCSELTRENSWIISLAHPNNNLTIEEFEQRIPHYMKSWINAVEINSIANEQWVNVIKKYKEKYWYLITFGSDCHFDDKDDWKHSDFCEQNEFVRDSYRDECFEEFREYLEI